MQVALKESLVLTGMYVTFAVQSIQPATVGGCGMGPVSFSKARATDNSRLSSPGLPAIIRPVGVPVESKPMGKARAASTPREHCRRPSGVGEHLNGRAA